MPKQMKSSRAEQASREPAVRFSPETSGDNCAFCVEHDDYYDEIVAGYTSENQPICFNCACGRALAPLRQLIDSFFEQIQALPHIRRRGALHNVRYLAIDLSSQGCHGLAVEAYERASKIDPEEVMYHYDKGLILVQLSRYREAISSLERSLGARPDCEEAEVYRLMAWVYERLGQHAEAAEAHRKAAELSTYDASE